MFNFRPRENCELASKIFKDRPKSALEEAVYWTEYVMRYNGAPHLRTKGSLLPWYQYYLIDVLSIAFTVIVIILTTIYLIISSILKVIFKKKVTKKQKKN